MTNLTRSAGFALLVATAFACGKEPKEEAWHCSMGDVPMGEALTCSTSSALTADGPSTGAMTSGGGGGGSTSDGTGPTGGTRDGTIDGEGDDDGWTPYLCLSGSKDPDCPPPDVVTGGGGDGDGSETPGAGGGSTSDGTTPDGKVPGSGGNGGGSSGGGSGGGSGDGGGGGGGGSTSDGTTPGGGNGNGPKGPDECVHVPDLPYCAPPPGDDCTCEPPKKKDPPGTSSGGESPPKKKGPDLECKKNKKGDKTCTSKPDCGKGTKPSKCGACVPEGEGGDCVPPSEGGCWVTGGGFIATNDGKDNFGGNAKPMKDGRIQGNWNHVDHGAGQHAKGKPDYLVCRRVDGAGPGQPGGKKGFVMNQVYFGGPASWNGASGYWFDVVAKDRGEPGKNDTYHFTLRNAAGAKVYEASGVLQGGNIQMHPPNNGHPASQSKLPAWVSYEP